MKKRGPYLVHTVAACFGAIHGEVVSTAALLVHVLVPHFGLQIRWEIGKCPR